MINLVFTESIRPLYRRLFMQPVTGSLLAACLALTACSARYDIRLIADGSAEARLQATIAPSTTNLIVNLSSLGQTMAVSGFNPLDAVSIRNSLAEAGGVISVAISNSDPQSINGLVAFNDVERFIASSDRESGIGSQLVNLDLTTDAPGGRVSFTLRRLEADKLLKALSPEINDYLSALMAPIATGEVLSEDEYLEIVSAVYGDRVAGEIASGCVTVELELPAKVVQVSGGIAKDRKALFVIPLTSLLVLESDLILEAAWK